VKQVLGQLGVHHLTQPIKELSGGQRKRVAMARVLIEEPEFLILDEPTNHLDLEMIEWLEDYLIGLNKTILLVTHDRYFLENVCNEIVELDRKKLYTYKGNYSYFIEKKQEREERENSEIGKARNLYRKELDWMRRMPKARSTKAKSRIDAFYKVEEKAKQKTNDQGMKLDVKMSRLGSKILEARHLNLKYNDRQLIKKFTYVFRKGDRVGIVGPNGCGKTTLLKLLMGQIEPDTGNVETGETVVFGYYSQDGLIIKEDKRIIDFVKSFADIIPLGNGEHLTASQFLQRFQFAANKQHTFISKLSGGERRRLHLLSVLIKNPNFLILDEPTNDLDILTLNTLEEFLADFGGCLVIVSHDRYFMDKLVDHLFVFEEGGLISDFPGNYSDYRISIAEKEQKEKQEEKEKQQIINPKKETGKKKPGFKEKHEFKELEKELEELEGKKTFLTAQLNEGKGSHNDFANWSKELDATIKAIETKTERWLELSEILEA
jgi:ATP-binding cassette subfamily F protein uup